MWKHEDLPHCGPHQHLYQEFKEPKGGAKVSEALGHPVRKKGETGGGAYTNYEVKGTPAQAMGYIASDEWCRICHTGDCNGAKWLFDEPHNLKPWVSEEHEECRKKVHKIIYDKTIPASHVAHKHIKYKCELKGTSGPVHIWGELRPRGKGSARKGGTADVQQDIIKDISAGKSRSQLYLDYPAYLAKYHAWFDKHYVLHAPKRRWMPAVYMLHGKAGTDKSALARAVAPEMDTYEKPDSEKWWYGYDGQDVIVINDIRKGDERFSRLLKILDRGPFEVEIKGSSVPLLAKVIILTSSMPHHEMWAELAGNTNDNLDQMTRRLNNGEPVEGYGKPCNEYDFNEMTYEDKEELLCKIRKDVERLRDPANWDKPKFSVWDGKSPVPEPPHKKRKLDEIHEEGCYCQECVNAFLD